MPVTFPPGFKPLPFSDDRIFLFEYIDRFIREHAEEFVATGRWLDTDANLERQVLRHGRVLNEGSLPRFERFQLIASRIKADPPNYSVMTREQQREAGRRVLLVVWLMTTPHVTDTTKPITRMQEWQWGDPAGMGLALTEEADEHTPSTDDGFQIAGLNRMFARVVLCNEDAGPPSDGAQSDVAVWAEIGYAALIAANGGESLTPPLVTRTTEMGGLPTKTTILNPTATDYVRAGVWADHPDASRAAGRFRREGLTMLGASNVLAPQFKQEPPLEDAAAIHLGKVAGGEAILTETQREIITALLEKNAVTSDRRIAAQDLVKMVAGKHAEIDLKRPLADLVKKGIVHSKIGRGGGYWLSDNGQTRASKSNGAA
jgi:hypothetical protein